MPRLVKEKFDDAGMTDTGEQLTADLENIHYFARGVDERRCLLKTLHVQRHDKL